MRLLLPWGMPLLSVGRGWEVTASVDGCSGHTCKDEAMGMSHEGPGHRTESVTLSIPVCAGQEGAGIFAGCFGRARIPSV